MKCVILAGGSGNRLWPLSRNNYPKQFINIKDRHSLLQETVVRNIPYCEEFLIVTNKKYDFIVESQMRVFQGLKYRCLYEEEPRKTAPAITLAALLSNPSEVLLIVTADHLISGDGYQKAILEAQSAIREGCLALFGLKPEKAHAGYGYIKYSGCQVTGFHEKPSADIAEVYVNSGEYLWNSGIYMFYAGDFLNELRRIAPEVYKTSMDAVRKISRRGFELLFPKELMCNIPAGNIEGVLLEKEKNMKVIRADFAWLDVSDLESLEGNTDDADNQNVIENDCTNTLVINRADDKLVVVNNLDNAIVVNTEDATYVSRKGSTFQIKQIVKEYYKKYETFFEDNVLMYRSWGTYEVLKNTPNYKVKKVTVYPEKSLTLHKHLRRSEHWSIVQGFAAITVGGVKREYGRGANIEVPEGTLHQVANKGDDNLVIIEIAIGESVAESDTISFPQNKPDLDKQYEIVRLLPAFKDYLWGGTKLREQFQKNCDYDIIAESWELSAHPDGESVIADGKHKGQLFSDYLGEISENALGWKCKSMNAFPILIKFIDAKSQLSVQVHPDDEYALQNEQEYGKNEMWYIMECEEGASIYYGFNRNVTLEEVRQHISDNTLVELLNKVPVHKGDVFFVDAGTVHAIGAGVMICEIQQSSNSTYRLYDYGRVDKYGNQRELHIGKALDVLNTNCLDLTHLMQRTAEEFPGYKVKMLGSCKYFECLKYEVSGCAIIHVDDSSFISLTFLEGEGRIKSAEADREMAFGRGDSFFIPAGSGNISVEGSTVFILTHV
ncbi:hypothetical protein GCM10008922_34290 [Faecalicatena contorta]|uniref:type I phosphomannose isomerase catalytic subunit n=1 Tax=Faecalicatena contorta TaxID=39482 RepID=UPI0031CE43D0